MSKQQKPKDEVKTAPRPNAGTGVNLRAFHNLMTKRFSKILAELAK